MSGLFALTTLPPLDPVVDGYLRFIVRTDHVSRSRCTGVVASLQILLEKGGLPSYDEAYAEEIFRQLNERMPCPPFEEKKWDADCVCWFKTNETAREWISIFRDIIALLEEADLEVATLVTERPGMIVYEDSIQVVAKSKKY